MHFFMPQSFNESIGGPPSDDISSGAPYVQNQLLNALHIATAFPDGRGATSI